MTTQNSWSLPRSSKLPVLVQWSLERWPKILHSYHPRLKVSRWFLLHHLSSMFLSGLIYVCPGSRGTLTWTRRSSSMQLRMSSKNKTRRQSLRNFGKFDDSVIRIEERELLLKRNIGNFCYNIVTCFLFSIYYFSCIIVPFYWSEMRWFLVHMGG